MRIIELLGIPGSGKATLLPKIQEFFWKSKMYVLSNEEAVYVCMKRNFPYNIILKITPKSKRTNTALKLYKEFLQDKYKKHFKERNRELFRAVYFSQQDSDIEEEHKKALMDKYLELGAQREFLEENLDDNDHVIFGEGFINRTANLLMSEDATEDIVVIKRVLKLIPKIYLAIFVHADTALCTTRMMSRGRIDRLRDKSVWDIKNFMEHSKGVMDLVETFLTRSGVKIFRIDNNDPLERVEYQMAEVLSPVLGKNKNSPAENVNV